MNILVHAIGSPLGQSILKSLKISNLDLNIFVSDIYEDAAGFHLVKSENRIVLPPVKSENYDFFIKNYLFEKDIKIIFPVITAEHNYYQKNMNYFKSNNIEIVTMNNHIYDIINNKLKCIEYLEKENIAVPNTLLADNSETFYSKIQKFSPPYFIKPVMGASSNDNFIIENEDKLLAVINSFPSNYFIVQEFLKNPAEYTVGVYRSPRYNFEDTMVIKRELRFGLSYKGEVIENEQISKYALKICRSLNTIYSVNVQLRMRNNAPVLFEINPRLSSTTYVRAYFGFNEPEMIIKEKIGIVENMQFQKKTGKFSRYWEEVFFTNEK